jgi:hypothetical protein
VRLREHEGDRHDVRGQKADASAEPLLRHERRECSGGAGGQAADQDRERPEQRHDHQREDGNRGEIEGAEIALQIAADGVHYVRHAR